MDGDDGGLLFARQALVGRSTYLGGGLVADNEAPGRGADPRPGYVPVEWWVASCTRAENPVEAPGGAREGVSLAELGRDSRDPGGAAEVGLDRAAHALLGGAGWRDRWPLVKLLDIGGRPVRPDFGGGGGDPAEEVPPIPAHVHSGYIVGGRPRGKGKYEAYYYPDVAPLGGAEPAAPPTLRLGVRDGVTREQLVAGVGRFGRDDSVYALLNAYAARPGEGWSVPPGVVHAPAPRLTLEVQRPQDDFNLLSWQMGRRLEGGERREQQCACVHRGVDGGDAGVVDLLVRWEEPGVGADEFARRYRRPPRPLDEGAWGRRDRIFFNLFRGERLVLRPGARYERPADDEPCMLLVWNGAGSACGQRVAHSDAARREAVLVAGRPLVLECDADAAELRVFCIFPLDEAGDDGWRAGGRGSDD